MTVFKGLPDKAGIAPYEDTRRVTNGLLAGKMNVAGTFTVAANTLETKVIDRNVGEDSYIGFTGLDENSLSGVLYVKAKNVLRGSFTVGHDSYEACRRFSYVVIG